MYRSTPRSVLFLLLGFFLYHFAELLALLLPILAVFLLFIGGAELLLLLLLLVFHFSLPQQLRLLAVHYSLLLGIKFGPLVLEYLLADRNMLFERLLVEAPSAALRALDKLLVLVDFYLGHLLNSCGHGQLCLDLDDLLCFFPLTHLPLLVCLFIVLDVGHIGLGRLVIGLHPRPLLPVGGEWLLVVGGRLALNHGLLHLLFIVVVHSQPVRQLLGLVVAVRVVEAWLLLKVILTLRLLDSGPLYLQVLVIVVPEDELLLGLLVFLVVVLLDFDARLLIEIRNYELHLFVGAIFLIDAPNSGRQCSLYPV